MPEEYSSPSSQGHERGRNAGRETGKGDQKTNGETKSSKASQESKRKQAEAQAKKEAGAKAKQTPKHEIPYKEAKEPIEVISDIQDEKKVALSPEQAQRILRFVSKYSDKDLKVLAKMAEEEPELIIQEAQIILRSAKKIKIKDADLDFEVKTSKGKLNKKILEEQAQKVQNPDEELPESTKIKDFVDFGEAQFKLAGATMAAEDEDMPSWLEELPDVETAPEGLKKFIRQTIRVGSRARSAASEYNNLQVIEKAINEAILSGEFDDTDPAVEKLEEAISKHLDGLEKFTEGVRGPRSLVEARTRKTVETLLTLASEGITSGDEWNNTRAELDHSMARVQALIDAEELVGFDYAFDVDKAITDLLVLRRRDLEKLPEDTLKELRVFTHKKEGMLAQLDAKFRRVFNDLTDDEREKLIGDIERTGNSYLKQIISGYGVTPEEAKKRLADLAGDNPVRQWRVLKKIKGIDDAVRVYQLTESTGIWEEAPEQIDNVYKFIENTDFSVDDLRIYINKALTILESVPTNIPEGRALRTKLTKELEAFRAFHTLRITLENNDMDPGDLLGAFRSYFDDETFVYFVSRFGRDEHSRQFVIFKKDEKGRYIDEDGKPVDIKEAADFVKVAREEVNLLDIGFELYSEQLREDRINMNIVEEMTKHAIESPFDGATMGMFEKWLGMPLNDDLRGRIELLRLYFAEKTRAKINDPKNGDLAGMSVDEVWGRKKTLHTPDGREVDLLDFTNELIRDWHTKTTLQGAFGIVSKDDLADLAKEFGITEKEANARFLRKSFLDIRRDQVLAKLVQRIEDEGLDLRIDVGEGELPKEVDFETLKEAGFLESVNNNSYQLAWIIEWSNYDSIRIYSRDSKSKLRDDYDSVVYHQNTNFFFGRQIDQGWEFYHETNENRGRPKENDVNRIWKQYLPGKHSWIFPQNNVMTRWAGFFTTPEQNREIERRTRSMMQEWDFDNEKQHKEYYTWMKNVVTRDMIESGEISFGKGSKKFSEVANDVKLRKFEYIDVFIDRGKHVKFTNPEVFQDYLATPTDGLFMEINDKVKGFYSTRDARLFPWMTLAIRAHLEITMKHIQDLFGGKNYTTASREELIDDLVLNGNMEKQAGHKEMRKWLGFSEVTIGGSWGIPKLKTFKLPEFFGTLPFRRARQNMEGKRKGGWESRFLIIALFIAGFTAGLVEFAKQLPAQAFPRSQ